MTRDPRADFEEASVQEALEHVREAQKLLDPLQVPPRYRTVYDDLRRAETDLVECWEYLQDVVGDGDVPAAAPLVPLPDGQLAAPELLDDPP